jgi:hypothetical protein
MISNLDTAVACVWASPIAWSLTLSIDIEPLGESGALHNRSNMSLTGKASASTGTSASTVRPRWGLGRKRKAGMKKVSSQLGGHPRVIEG